MNAKINGWDERDYCLWSEIRTLPSFGIIAGEDRMVSQQQVLNLLKKHAEKRYAGEHAGADKEKGI